MIPKANLKVKWGDIVNGQPQFPVHKAQADVLNSTAKYTAALAGSGGGKSVLIALWLYMQWLKKPQGTFLIVLQNLGQIESTELIDRLRMTFQGTYRPGKAIFEISSGGRILIKTDQNPEGIEGIHADAIAIDEAKDISNKTWKFTKSRSGSKNAPILITTTPDVDNWVITEIYNNCENVEETENGIVRWSNDGQYYVRQWGSTTNPGYAGKELLEQEKATLSAAEFDRRYRGIVTKIDGLVYDQLSNHILSTPDNWQHEFAIHPVIKADAGIDFGFDPDPCSISVGVECQDNRVYIVEEVYKNRLSYDELALECHRLKDKWGIQTFFCDSSGKAAIHELRIRGINASMRTIPAINIGLTMVNARLRTGILKVYDCCTNLIFESQRYSWPKDKTGDLKTTPVDKFNHSCLIGDTIVTTSQGDVPIRDIRPGMMALTRMGWKEITAWALTRKQAKTYTVKLSNGEQITGTADHPVYVEGKGFCKIDTLTYGDRLLSAVPVYVVQVSEDKEPQDVFDITVDEAHEFFANGILVKNCDSLRYLITGIDYRRKLAYKPNDLATPEEKEQRELARKIMLGQVNADPDRRQADIIAATEAKYAEHRYKLAFGDLDDAVNVL